MIQDNKLKNSINGDRVVIKWRQKQKISEKSASISQTTNILTTDNTNGQSRFNNLASMKMAHLNINGLRNKVDLLTAELSEYDIICVSETKLNNSVDTSKLEINGFNQPIRRDRRYNNGGGLLIYIKNNIYYKRRQDIENQYIENIWIQVSSLKKQFLLGLFYRPPNSTVDYWDSFENCLELATDQNLDLIIMGDFNQDIRMSDNTTKFIKILHKFNIENMISEPTRITNT